MERDTTHHPCFHEASRHHFGRVHLPVARNCNIQCNFCNRKFDCPNENRPGVTRTLLAPRQALAYLGAVLERDSRVSVAGIAGPGDPLAEGDKTLETLRLVRERFPHLLLCLATNGLDLPKYVDELSRLDVRHVSVTLNAVDPTVGARICAWVRHGKRVYRGEKAAALLLERQREGIVRAKELGITVKINHILIPGVNDAHSVAVAEAAAALGADLFNCMPVYPVQGSAMEDVTEPLPEQVAAVRRSASAHLPQMTHCTRCRADAVGLLGEDGEDRFKVDILRCSRLSLWEDGDRPYVAVGSLEGMLVNQHLGEAERLWIFERGPEGIRLLETRKTPERGGGEARWRRLAHTLKDCRALFVSGIGASPRKVLEGEAIQVVEMEGLIEQAVDWFHEGVRIPSPRRRTAACGGFCGDSGPGC